MKNKFQKSKINSFRKKSLKIFTAFSTFSIGGIAVVGLAACGSKNYDVMLITDGGPITDRSFNESAWNGVREFGKQNPKAHIGYVQPINQDHSTFQRVYQTVTKKYLSPGGKGIIVVNGYLHEQNGNVIEFARKHKNTKFIGIDFDKNPNDKIDNNFSGLTFNASQSGFLAALYAGLYFNLNANLNGGYNKISGNLIKVATFGGLAIPGVTPYMDGFLLGQKYFNTSKSIVQEDSTIITKTSKVRTFENIYKNGKGPSKADFTDGFEADNKKIAPLADYYFSEGVNLILPVAGPQITGVMARIRKSDQWVYGVDSDQTKKFEHLIQKKQIFGSAIKGIKDAVDSKVSDIYKKHESGSTSYGFEDNKNDKKYVGFDQNPLIANATIDKIIRNSKLWQQAVNDEKFLTVSPVYKGKKVANKFDLSFKQVYAQFWDKQL